MEMWAENPCGMLIRQIHMGLSKKSDNGLKEHDLTLSQVTALLFLLEADGKELSLKELERLMQVSQPDAAGIAIRLEKKKMIESYQDASDKRMKRIRLTPHGEERCAEAKKNMAAFEDTLLKGLTKGERSMLRELLEKVSRNV